MASLHRPSPSRRGDAVLGLDRSDLGRVAGLEGGMQGVEVPRQAEVAWWQRPDRIAEALHIRGGPHAERGAGRPSVLRVSLSVALSGTRGGRYEGSDVGTRSAVAPAC